MRVSSLGREDPLEQGMATIPVFLPGKFQGQRSLADHKELDRLSMHAYIEHARIYIIINETDNIWKTPIYCESSYEHGGSNRTESTKSGARGLGANGARLALTRMSLRKVFTFLHLCLLFL